MVNTNTSQKIEEESFTPTHWWDTPLELLGLKEKSAEKDTHEIVNESQEKEPKGLKHSRVGKEMAEYSLSSLETQTELSTLRESAERMGIDVTKEDWEGELADRIESAQKNLSGLNGDGNGEKKKMRKLFEETLKIYGETNAAGRFQAKKLSPENLLEIAKRSWKRTEDSFVLFRPFVFIKEIFLETMKWYTVKKYEKEINSYFLTKKEGKKLVKKIKNTGKQAKETYQSYKKGKDKLSINPAGVEGVRRLGVAYKGKVHETVGKLLRKDLSPKKAAQQIKKITTQTANEGLKKGKLEFLTEVRKGKFPGLAVKTTGKFMAIEIFTRGFLEGIEQRRFGAFTETITDSNTWAEAVPIVGSVRSVERLFIDNDEPFLAKIADAGLNIAGDMYLGYITVQSLGLGTATVGMAGRAGLIAAGRKGLQKLVTRQGARQALKNAPKNAKKAMAALGRNWGTAAFVTGLALTSAFPEGKIEEIVTDVAVNNLTSGEKKLLQVAGVGGEQLMNR